jgi:hypothetical protein
MTSLPSLAEIAKMGPHAVAQALDVARARRYGSPSPRELPILDQAITALERRRCALSAPAAVAKRTLAAKRELYGRRTF